MSRRWRDGGSARRAAPPARRGRRLVTLPPWSRAPLLLLASPGAFLAVAGGAAVLAVAAASGPLFLSSTGSAALARATAAECPEAPLPAVTYPRTGILHGPLNVLQDVAGLRRTDGAVRSAFTRSGLPPGFRVLTATPELDTRQPGAAPAEVTLLSRPGALDHVTVLRRVPGPGLWFSDRAAARLGLAPGDTVAVGSERARVVGTYRDLDRPPGSASGVPRYWCTWTPLIRSSLDNRPPPLVLTDDATLLRLAHAFAGRPGVPLEDAAGATWYSTVDTARLTLARAGDLVRRGAGLPAALGRRSPALARNVSYGGDLADDAARAGHERAGVRGSVVPTAAAGTLVAVLLVAATGAYWAQRRRREAALLVARGVGPAGIAVKAVLEALPATLAGGAAGWAGARVLVALAGPSRLVEPGAGAVAALAVAVALLAGLAALGVLAALRSPRPDRRAARAGAARRARMLRRLPWEAVPLGPALAAYLAIRDGSAVRTAAGGVVSVSPLLVAFPLCALAGGLLAACRATAALLPLLRRAGDRLPPAPYLATRRLTGTARITLGMVALVSVPVGLLAYGGTVTRSTSATVRAKAGVYTGAQAVLVVNVPPGSTPDAGGRGTVVSLLRDGRTSAGQVEVLGVDPATFARSAYADRAVLGGSPAGLVRRLDPHGRGGTGTVPAILAGCTGCGTVDRVGLRTSTLDVRVVARLPLFPGMRVLGSPVLVVDRRALADVDPFADRQEELWTTDRDLPAAARALDRHHVTATYRKTPGRFLDAVDLVPLTWTFGYLEALAALTGLVAFGALLLYLGARQRATAASHVMVGRMGLTRAGHLRSLGHEVGGLVAYGWLVGAATGAVACVLVDPLLDLDPDFPPAALLRAPVDLLAGSAVGAAVAVAVGVLVAARAAGRHRPAEILHLDA